MILHDLRCAARSLAAQKVFSVVALATLALGIGANTAIFAVVSGVLLRPLPYREPARVVMLWSHWTGWKKTWLSEPELDDYRAQAGALDALAGFAVDELNLAGPGEPVRVRAARAQATIFAALGVTPGPGRTYTPDEDRPGAPRVVMLSERVWRAQFGADPAIVGRRVRLDGIPYEIVGVLGDTVRLPIDYQSRLQNRRVGAARARNPGSRRPRQPWAVRRRSPRAGHDARTRPGRDGFDRKAVHPPVAVVVTSMTSA